ncbi:hypothetical protein [Sphingomonas sp. CLY1604]|uniref:hypothetical protein n=1 Tax=Sphingomonas sp. CLY1604 TaxID=3457786 RepID=UPI003FD81143
MKRKTGTEILGSRLFANRRAYDDLIRKLRSDVITHLHQLRRARPDVDIDHLKNTVRAGFEIHPLVIHDLAAIRIETLQRDFLNDYDCWMSGHLHEAHVPYTGDQVFWRMQHLNRVDFPFRGKFGPHAMRLRIFVDGEDYDGFKADVEKALRTAREMLRMTERSQLLLAEQAREIVEDALTHQLPA